MILYVSYRFETDIGAAIHLDILKELYGPENVFVADLQMKDAREEQNYVAFGKYRNKLARIQQWLQGNTMHISDATIQSICRLIKSKEIRQVFIEDSIFGNLARTIKQQFPEVSIFAFFHDIAADLYRQKSRHSKSWITKMECAVAVRQERIQQKYTDVNVVFSRRESDLYRKYYGCEPQAVIPLSAYIPNLKEEYTDGGNGNAAQKHLLFVGTRYWPNIVGIRWFCHNVLPDLSDTIVLDIVGRGTEFLREEFTDRRVKVHGTVDDVARYYQDADIVIAPLFDGGGMKTKTAEAISFGKCIIGTDEGLTGFWDDMDDSVCGKSVYLCNTVQHWIDTINRLADTAIPKFNQPLYDLFMEKFSYQATKKALTDLLNQR